MDLGLGGRTALVTGAGRGLGASIARTLASEGVRVLVASRGEAALEKLLSSLPETHDHKGLSIDLEQDAAIDSLLSWVDHLGVQVDIVVNNVGGTLDVNDPFAAVDEYRRVMDLNLNVSVAVNRHLIPKMQQRKWGRICHVSSISALENQGPPAYCAAKAALNAYIRSVGRFVAADNVVLTGIMPGAVLTEGGYWDKASRERPEHVKSYLTERMAIRRFGYEAEIADSVAFLVSERASFLVGSMLLADGGQGRVFYGQGDS